MLTKEIAPPLKKLQNSKEAGSTISTLLHDKINPKDCQVLSLGVSSDYGKPRGGVYPSVEKNMAQRTGGFLSRRLVGLGVFGH